MPSQNPQADRVSCIVPGIARNPSRGLQRSGKLRLSRREVFAIFDPVVDEVVSLVTSQIRATKQKVKAVLLVGGFGQNTYLMDRIVASIGRDIKVMRPLNGYVI
jgi:hypothetical protein